MSTGTIKKVAGPLVIATGMRDANMFDVVRVSSERLIGEIIEMHGDEASIQVYEETSGLGPGEPVESINVPLSVELGPGLIGSIFDGIQRPLDEIRRLTGNNLKRGVEVPSLNREKKWSFVPSVAVGDELEAGDVLGTVQETESVVQKIMVPPNMAGTVKSISRGEYTVEEPIAVLSTKDGDQELTMMQRWPVRKGRPYAEKLPPEMPLITGQRVIDALFPIAKGGVAAVPGPFGSGKKRKITHHPEFRTVRDPRPVSVISETLEDCPDSGVIAHCFFAGIAEPRINAGCGVRRNRVRIRSQNICAAGIVLILGRNANHRIGNVVRIKLFVSVVTPEHFRGSDSLSGRFIARIPSHDRRMTPERADHFLRPLFPGKFRDDPNLQFRAFIQKRTVTFQRV